jgi:hypothetical protein
VSLVVHFYISFAWSCFMITTLPYMSLFLFADRFHDGIVMLTIAAICWTIMAMLLLLDRTQDQRSAGDVLSVFLRNMLRRHVFIGNMVQIVSNIPLFLLLLDGNLEVQDASTPLFPLWLVATGGATLYMFTYNLRMLLLARRAIALRATPDRFDYDMQHDSLWLPPVRK